MDQIYKRFMGEINVFFVVVSFIIQQINLFFVYLYYFFRYFSGIPLDTIIQIGGILRKKRLIKSKRIGKIRLLHSEFGIFYFLGALNPVNSFHICSEVKHKMKQ